MYRAGPGPAITGEAVAGDARWPRQEPSAFGRNRAAGCGGCPAHINFDGVVNTGDLILLLSNGG